MTADGTKKLMSLSETTRIQSVVDDKVDLFIDDSQQPADVFHTASLIDTCTERFLTGNCSLKRKNE
jgi:hypothetical protein